MRRFFGCREGVLFLSDVFQISVSIRLKEQAFLSFQLRSLEEKPL